MLTAETRNPKLETGHLHIRPALETQAYRSERSTHFGT
jgi:hypothetical protein